MRAAKFRGKRANGEWVFGNLLTGVTDNGVRVSFIAPKLPFVAEAYDLWGATMYRVEPNSVGQFTGLVNKAGREIYEGDILKMANCDFRGEVRWHKNGYFYINEYYPNVIDDDYSPLGNMLRYDMDVIGNVFDNPELMKGGQK